MNRLSIILLVILTVSISACAPSQLLGSKLTILPTNTQVISNTPPPTITLPPTKTPTPTIPLTPTFTLTPTPGPELINYLPTTDNLPQCTEIVYIVYLGQSILKCYLPDYVELSASVLVQAKSFTQADLKHL